MLNTGSCACGNIGCELKDEPINQVFCYCTECQITTGTDKWFGLWFPIAQLEFPKGTPHIYTRKGSSGKDIYFNYCGDCGTTVCGEFTAGGFYSVAAATIHGNEEYFPKMCIYTKSAPKWAVFPKEVPQFETLPPEFQ